MNLKDFKEAVKSLFGFEFSFDKPDDIACDAIGVSWSTGGVSGGSCWESSNPRPYTSSDKRPEFKALDLVLRQFAPQISYLDYRELSAKIITEAWTEREYYGNCTDYQCEYINLDDLYSFLKEKGCL